MSNEPCTTATRVTVMDPEGRERSATLLPGQLGPIRLGRAPENDIQIISPYVSRRHAEIWPHSGGVTFKDLSSTSGSYQRGKRIQFVTLAFGDEINLGSPSGLSLRVLSEEIDEDTNLPSKTNTEVLRVVNVRASQYVSARDLTAQKSSAAM